MSGGEWEADVLRGDKLEVPEEEQRRMRYRILAVGFRAEGRVVEAWCASVQFHPVGNVLELQDALVDTSEKFEGTTIKARVTHHAKILLWGVGAMILPYRYQEKEEPRG